MRHCFDCASDKSCIVVIWSHLCILRKERERGDSFTLFVKLCLTERFQIIQILENYIFKLSYLKKKYELEPHLQISQSPVGVIERLWCQRYNYFTHTT